MLLERERLALRINAERDRQVCEGPSPTFAASDPIDPGVTLPRSRANSWPKFDLRIADGTYSQAGKLVGAGDVSESD